MFRQTERRGVEDGGGGGANGAPTYCSSGSRDRNRIHNTAGGRASEGRASEGRRKTEHADDITIFFSLLLSNVGLCCRAAGVGTEQLRVCVCVCQKQYALNKTYTEGEKIAVSNYHILYIRWLRVSHVSPD